MNLRFFAIQRVLGIIVMLSSLSKLPPVFVALWYGEGAWWVFFSSCLLSLSIGAALWWPVRRIQYQLRLRDGFLIVSAAWILASLVSALPFMHAEPHLDFTAAMFEATSGLTTTGATIITGLDDLPRSVLFYRQLLQFVGGMGIVILAVAILPMLRIGGTQLFRAESAGLTRDTKLTPRIAETAKALWAVYFALTGLCIGAYWVAGMDFFDAVCHALTTVSTAGFSTYDASLGHFDSAAVETVAIIFMALGGMNFGLHFVAWRRATMNPYQHDAETIAYLRILAVASIVIALVIWVGGTFNSFPEALRHATFHAVSAMTTTGFGIDDYSTWAGVAPLLVVLLAVIGGSSGSTASGLKVARVVMLLQQGYREIVQLVHPKGQFLVKIGGRRVSESVVLSVSGFIAIWALCFMLVVVGMNMSGLDLESAFGATIATFTNLGPGLGEVASNFSTAPVPAVWLGTVAMVFGRLEVFAILVLLTPAFWRE
ncbi:MAG: potassium transporter TrkG [Lysobacteraceae bacterium]